MRKIKQWSTTRSCVAPLKLNEMAEIKIAVSMFGKMVKLQWLNYYLYKLRNWLTFTFLAVLNLKFILTHSNLKILIKAALIFFFLITFWRLLWNALVLFTFCRVYPYIRYLCRSPHTPLQDSTLVDYSFFSFSFLSLTQKIQTVIYAGKSLTKTYTSLHTHTLSLSRRFLPWEGVGGGVQGGPGRKFQPACAIQASLK